MAVVLGVVLSVLGATPASAAVSVRMDTGGWIVEHTGVVSDVSRGSSSTYPASAPSLTAFTVPGDVVGSFVVPPVSTSAYQWLRLTEDGVVYNYSAPVARSDGLARLSRPVQLDTAYLASDPLPVYAVNGLDPWMSGIPYPSLGVTGTVDVAGGVSIDSTLTVAPDVEVRDSLGLLVAGSALLVLVGGVWVGFRLARG